MEDVMSKSIALVAARSPGKAGHTSDAAERGRKPNGPGNRKSYRAT